MTTAAELVHAPPIEVWPDMSLRAFAELLVENDIGAALVRGTEGRVSGVISERDVVRALADGADADADRVGDYMTFEVESAQVGTPVATLAEMLVADGIRHLPIDDAEGRVVGVISIRDVLAALTR